MQDAEKRQTDTPGTGAAADQNPQVISDEEFARLHLPKPPPGAKPLNEVLAETGSPATAA